MHHRGTFNAVMNHRSTFRIFATPSFSVRRTLGTALLSAAVLSPSLGCKGRSISLSSFMHADRKSKSKPNSTEYSDALHQAAGTPQVALLKLSDDTPDQPTVQQFYNDRNWEVAWTRDGKPTATAKALIQLFAEADKKGLRPDDYDGPRWQEHVQSLSGGQNAVAQFDVAMTVAAIRYLSDLHLGRINPQSLNFDIDVPAKRAAFDLPTLLNEQVVDADDVGSVVAGVESQNPLYKNTEAALPHYLDLAKQQAGQPPQPLPPVAKPIGPGGSYPGLAQLAQRLALEGDGTPQANGTQYNNDFAQAVQHFQNRNGLLDDGKLSQATVDALNVPMSARVQAIGDSLERWRWLPEPYQKPRLLVNLAEYYVRAYKPSGDLDFKMKVVDGEAKDNHNTPVFVRNMKYLVFRPYWNLPTSIVKKDLLKHTSAGYMESHGYEVTDSSGKPVSGWSAADLEHSRYLVRQKPGPKNSLGLVKFMFPNEYDIYMHSTPEMNLFNLAQRDRSHGCVRLNDAEKMANWVLDGQGDWNADKIHQAMFGEPANAGEPGDSTNPKAKQTSSDPDSGSSSTDSEVKDNHQVNLQTQLPVVLTYLTANADEDGTMHFFKDVYGYDQSMEEELAKPRPYSREAVKINPKLTPGETE